MDIRAWLQKQAPDFVATFARFPLGIALSAVATATFIALINGYIGGLDEEGTLRAVPAFATGAVAAVAGVFFVESGAGGRLLGGIIAYVLPLLVVAAFFVTDTAWLVPWALPVVAVLWLSVSPFVRRGDGAGQQDRFWWINQLAIASAAIGAAAFLIIAIGIAAIERSLSILFGLESGEVFYRWVMPFVGTFLTPLYWLSTLPRIADYPAEGLRHPDFTGKAAGFLGQFVLVPFLFIYAAILLAYTAQIVVTQQMPQGVIGWMVMGFVVAGAATWLVLHPAFMRARPLVRAFRHSWFWLTLIPLALFFFAVWVRIDAYGLTAERVLLLLGGVWASALAAVFLVRRGDIRFVPGLAATILLVMSVGPWNFLNLPMVQQLGRLDALVMNAGADKSASPPRGNWNEAEIAEARGIIDYLAGTRAGQRGVREVLGRYGVTWDAGQDGSYVVLEALGVSVPSTEGVQRYTTLFRDFDNASVDVAATPYLLRPIGLYGNMALDALPLRFWAQDGVVRVGPKGVPDRDLPMLDLGNLLAEQTESFLASPVVTFVVDERKFALVVQSVTIDRGENNAGPTLLSSMEAQLFSDRP